MSSALRFAEPLRAAGRHAIVVALVVALAVAGLLALPMVHAAADTAPTDPNSPQTVSADPLPTVQVNGVVWSQVTVGNTVYAAGSFDQSWPAGSARGGADTVTVGNLIAYNITTGQRVTSFDHVLNGQARFVTASPDGSRVYVGGDFTTVDGVTHDRIAAFDTASGALVSKFKADIGAEVTALSATNTTVYAGGSFFTANSAPRNRVAAFTATTGAVLTWRPRIDDNNVTAMLLSPDRSRMIITGHFTSVNGSPALGIVAVDPTSGATMSWNPAFPIHDADAKSAITSLTTDGTSLFGTGYVFGGSGNLEGRFASDFAGNISWINSCHGDTYSAYVTGQVLYSVGHGHDCSDLGLYDDTSPHTYHRALAETTYPTGTLGANNNANYADFSGQPDSTQLYWYPVLSAGTFTGEAQAAWSVTGSGSYIALGGEFPRVNGTAQSGLVRFALKTAAPNKTGPVALPGNKPSATSTVPGTARVDWATTYDYDNLQLTYKLYRDGSTTPIYTVTRTDPFWKLPELQYSDTGLALGSTHTYLLRVYDPFNNKRVTAASAPVTIASAPASNAYVDDVQADGATNLWRLSEPAGPVAFDSIGTNDLSANTGTTFGAPPPFSNDPSTAATFAGTSLGAATSRATAASTPSQSLEAWVSTTSNRGGKIVGLGDAQAPTQPEPTANSVTYDRQLYLDNSGRFVLAVRMAGAWRYVRTSGSYNDGAYHHVVATIGANGLFLFVDGSAVSRDQTATGADSFAGYWHIGGDNVAGLPAKGTSGYLAGNIGDVAVYPSVLRLGQVQRHYLDGGRSKAIAPQPADAYGRAVYQDDPDMYWRFEDGGTTAADSSRSNLTGTYASGTTGGVAGAFAGSGAAVTLDGTKGIVSANAASTNPQVYSEELWFKSSTQSGGRLIGFGTGQTKTSTSADRNVYLTNSGQVAFTESGVTPVTVTSPNSYNDGAWHYLVATQGADGMHLYVDGTQVGSDPNAAAQSYNGYWRVGGDRSLSGATSAFAAATIDEAAVYPRQLSASRIAAHYDAAGGNVAPVAAFTQTCSYRACSFDAGASGDIDGTVTYSWDLGDGATSTAAAPSHLYATNGSHQVTLMVTDDKGATSVAAASVVTSKAPPPSADFSSSCAGRACSFDGSASTSPVGVASYSWDFGDGTTGTGATPHHTFGASTTYSVQLSVVDTQGTPSAVTSHDVTVTNQAPTAAFTTSCTGLTCTLDGTASTDPDGTVSAYAWTFADGATSTSATPTHSFGAAGDYRVNLAVTDDSGAADHVAKTVVVRPPANPDTSPYARDMFNRATSGGLGTADKGGTWTASGSTANLAVGNAGATVTMSKATAAPGAYLAAVASTDTSVTTTLAVDKIGNGGGTSLYVIGRRVALNEAYRGVVHVLSSGVVNVGLVKLDGSSTAVTLSAEHAVAGLTYSPGTKLDVRLEVTGTAPTTARMRVWVHGGGEPATWQATASDSSAALQSAGAVGLAAYLSGSATNAPVVETVSAFQAGPTNTPPAAAFTASCAALSCSLDASASSDPQGNIVSYAWSFGDGAPAAGKSASHTFAVAGTYRVTLTVTDSAGLTDVATSTVTAG